MTEHRPRSALQPNPLRPAALDVSVQMDRLRGLADGWLDGDGRAPRADGLEWLGRAIQEHFPLDLPNPHLYPTEDGGVQAEWTIGAREISMTVDLGSRSAEWQAVDIETGITVSERDLDLERDDSWRWIHDAIADAAHRAPSAG